MELKENMMAFDGYTATPTHPPGHPFGRKVQQQQVQGQQQGGIPRRGHQWPRLCALIRQLGERIAVQQGNG